MNPKTISLQHTLFALGGSLAVVFFMMLQPLYFESKDEDDLKKWDSVKTKNIGKHKLYTDY